jgi:hypothetical protein
VAMHMMMQLYLGDRSKRCEVGCQLLDSFQETSSFCILAPFHGPLQLICSERSMRPVKYPVTLENQMMFIILRNSLVVHLQCILPTVIECNPLQRMTF